MEAVRALADYACGRYAYYLGLGSCASSIILHSTSDCFQDSIVVLKVITIYIAFILLIGDCSLLSSLLLFQFILPF